MKIVSIEMIQPKNGYIFAEVVVEEGWLFFKRRRNRVVYREKHLSYWRWLDSGEYTPDKLIENAESAENARQAMR